MNTLVMSPEPRVCVSTQAPNRQSLQETVFWGLAAIVTFHVAYAWTSASWLIALYVFAMAQLSRAATGRRAFYAGFVVGMFIAVGQLTFFWGIFSAAAIPLWTVYAFWLGLFTVLARQCLVRFGGWAIWLLPFLWCGLEYFRSELYYLRFSWLSPGYAFGGAPSYAPIASLGVYGAGFVLMLISCCACAIWARSRFKALIVLAILMGLFCAAARVPPLQNTSRPTRGLKVAGIQLEFSTEKEVLRWLNELARVHPEAELLVLSEYTLSEPPSEALKAWCRGHRRFLIVGGKDPVSNGNFYNTAFVISPEGEIAFRQVKCVPIQFFKDGLPAPEQKLWDSPWGKLGICICYDLSYARVTDPLIRMGAEGLIVPTMDVADWGKRQHEMHARVGPIRAAEYRLPIFRLASSGISQAIDPAGKVLATAPCPGNTSMLAATLPLTDSARRPIDRWLAPLSTGIAGALLLATLIPSGVLSRKLPPAC